jgi:recombination protein RecT
MPENGNDKPKPEPAQAIIVQSPQAKALHLMLNRAEGEIAKALPRHLTAERMIRVVMTAVQRNPLLLECTPLSVMGSVITASQLGIEPDGVLGRGYLIPRRNKQKQWECHFQIGYLGLIELALRSDRVSWFNAELVFDCDTFKVTYGIDRNLIHEPDLDNPLRGEWDHKTKDLIGLRGAYAVVRYKDGSSDFEYMPLSRLHKLRGFSQSTESAYSPWNTELGIDDMYRKCPIRKLAKRTPLSPEFHTAVHEDEMAEGFMIDGMQQGQLADPDAVTRARISNLLVHFEKKNADGERWNAARAHAYLVGKDTAELEALLSKLEAKHRPPQQEGSVETEAKPEGQIAALDSSWKQLEAQKAEPKKDVCPDCEKLGAKCYQCSKKEKAARAERSKQFLAIVAELMKLLEMDTPPPGPPSITEFDKMPPERQQEEINKAQTYLEHIKKEAAEDKERGPEQPTGGDLFGTATGKKKGK